MKSVASTLKTIAARVANASGTTELVRGLVNNKPQAAVQCKLRDMINSSARQAKHQQRASVMQAVRQPGNALGNQPKVLQRRAFKSDEEALSWLKGHYTAQAASALPDEEDLCTFFADLLAEAEQNQELGSEGDRWTNGTKLQTLWLSNRDNVRDDVTELVATRGLQKVTTLTPSQKAHILYGEIKDGAIIGGHHAPSKLQDLAIVNRVDLGNGFYKATLTTTLKHKGKPIAPKESTFFPDDWTPREVVTAIE
ncbi:MAG: hypothetical protein EOO61_21520, partial [Hymenobacter sp.]